MASLSLPNFASTGALPRRVAPTVSPSSMYQLLGLVAERGSGGVVDKVVISQESVGGLVRLLSPGAYISITDVSSILHSTLGRGSCV